jgi:hypothetical protein
MAMLIQADKISEIIRSQTGGFEGKRVPAVEPFKPPHICH